MKQYSTIFTPFQDPKYVRVMHRSCLRKVQQGHMSCSVLQEKIQYTVHVMMPTTSNKWQNTELSNGQDVSKRRRDRADGGNEELGLMGRREQCVRCISFVL